MKYQILIVRGKEVEDVGGELVKHVQTQLDTGWQPLGGASISTSIHPVTLRTEYHFSQALVKLEPSDNQHMDSAEFKHRVSQIISEAVNA